MTSDLHNYYIEQCVYSELKVAIKSNDVEYFVEILDRYNVCDIDPGIHCTLVDLLKFACEECNFDCLMVLNNRFLYTKNDIIDNWTKITESIVNYRYVSILDKMIIDRNLFALIWLCMNFHLTRDDLEEHGCFYLAITKNNWNTIEWLFNSMNYDKQFILDNHFVMNLMNDENTGWFLCTLGITKYELVRNYIKFLVQDNMDDISRIFDLYNQYDVEYDYDKIENSENSDNCESNDSCATDNCATDSCATDNCATDSYETSYETTECTNSYETSCETTEGTDSTETSCEATDSCESTIEY